MGRLQCKEGRGSRALRKFNCKVIHGDALLQLQTQSNFHQNSCPPDARFNCCNCSCPVQWKVNETADPDSHTTRFPEEASPQLTPLNPSAVCESSPFVFLQLMGSRGQKDYACLKCHLSPKLDYNKQIKRQEHCENNLKRFFFLSINPEQSNTSSRRPFPIMATFKIRLPSALKKPTLFIR